MMQIIDIRTDLMPPTGGWLTRPLIDHHRLEADVQAILTDVRQHGDDAVRKYSLRFDQTPVGVLGLKPEEIAAGAAGVDAGLKAAIGMAAEQIRGFHQMQQRQEPVVETMPGVKCWRRAVAIE